MTVGELKEQLNQYSDDTQIDAAANRMWDEFRSLVQYILDFIPKSSKKHYVQKIRKYLERTKSNYSLDEPEANYDR